LIFRMLFFLAEKKLLEESCFKTAGEKWIRIIIDIYQLWRKDFSCQFLPNAALAKNTNWISQVNSVPRRFQGCQIFLDATYRNGVKYTKLPQHMPNVHKIYQMVAN
jgi:hypothetical protein